MKKLILSLAIISFLFACQGPRKEKKEQTIEDQITSELSQNIKNETIFLGLSFGMRCEDVFTFFKVAVSQGKLQLVPHEYISDEGKIYLYKFEVSKDDSLLENVTGTFKTYYIQDKLYKLRISIESEKEASLQLLKSKLKEVYISEYGEKYIKKENIYNNSDAYEWIIGNMMIEMTEGLSNNILIVYTDLIALKENEDTPKEVLMREI